MSFYDNLISEGKPTILLYNPSDNGEVIFEKWKTRIKFFHTSAALDARQRVEKEVNDFLEKEDKILVDLKFNCSLESLGEKVVVLLIYKERVE